MEENGRIETGQMWCDTRKRLGLFQKQAAELSGVSAKTVSRLENGAVNVQAFNKMKLAEAYGSSVAEIEGGLSQAQYEDIHEYISALVRIQDYKRYSDSFLLLGMILLILDLFVLAFACIAYKEGNIAICAEYILLTAVCLLASVMCFITSFTSGRRARKNEKTRKESL